MSVHIIGIGEWIISDNPDDTIKTYALGSCIAVMMYDDKIKAGGMIHIALPDSAIDPQKAEQYPGHFADTGLQLLIGEMTRCGATHKYMRIKIAGGAAIIHDQGFFDIGKKNLLAVKRILLQHSIGSVAEDTGGQISRTVSLKILDGSITISSSNKEWKL